MTILNLSINIYYEFNIMGTWGQIQKIHHLVFLHTSKKVRETLKINLCFNSVLKRLSIPSIVAKKN